MTKLRKILFEREISIVDLSKIIEKTPYRTGQKIKADRFNLDEIKKILKLLDMKFEDIF